MLRGVIATERPLTSTRDVDVVDCVSVFTVCNTCNIAPAGSLALSKVPDVTSLAAMLDEEKAVKATASTTSPAAKAEANTRLLPLLAVTSVPVSYTHLRAHET